MNSPPGGARAGWGGGWGCSAPAKGLPLDLKGACPSVSTLYPNLPWQEL